MPGLISAVKEILDQPNVDYGRQIYNFKLKDGYFWSIGVKVKEVLPLCGISSLCW